MSTLPDGFLAQEFSSSDELAQTPSSEYQLSLFCDTMANVPDDIARPSSTGDLTDRAVLDKIDHVRRLGIDIPLPQVASLPWPKAFFGLC
jgi:hypothetical protein